MIYFALALFLFALIILFVWLYLFNIYEVKYLVNPKLLYSNSYSEISIKAIAINSFGTKALFRSITVNFNLLIGYELVSIVKKNSGEIILKSLGKTGEVEVLITPQYGLFSSKIKIKIVEL